MKTLNNDYVHSRGDLPGFCSGCLAPRVRVWGPARRLASCCAVSRVRAVCVRRVAEPNRRAFLRLLSGVMISVLVQARTWSQAIVVDAAEQSPGVSASVVTASGLRYFDVAEGEGPSPDWGDLCVVDFVLYTVPRPKGPPRSGSVGGDNALQLRRIDSSHGRGYLIKHGNGRTIQGIEEAIHTMREHGRRRILVPPRLAYVHGDLGPIPAATWVRQALAKRLEQGELLVFDLELKKVMKDPKDRGYYNDKVVMNGSPLSGSPSGQ